MCIRDRHMAQHGIGTEIRKSELRSIRRELSTKFQQAVKYHRQFVEKVPNLSEKRQVCAKWQEEFEAAHKEVIEEIDQHLGQRSTDHSMVEYPDLEQTVGNLVNQLGEVQQQLTSQEQQFQQLAKKVDDKFDSISSKIEEVLLAKQPGMQASEDLKIMMEQLLNKQPESFISSLNDHKKTSAK